MSPVPPWQAELAAAFTRVDELLEFLQLPLDLSGVGTLAAAGFPLRVTRSYAGRMRRGDPADPLLRQVLPLADETLPMPGFVADPVGDLDAMAVPGLLHKYRGRALLVTTGACAIHCRYCFRREFPYTEGQLSRSREAEALDYVAQDDSLTELILSGGDPLALSDPRLAELFVKIDGMPRLRRLRIHTRLPIVLPSRVTGALIELLGCLPMKVTMVIHANHGAELDGRVAEALGRLKSAGVILLNQSVLLRGVNDSEAALTELSETLFDAGVLPYYLHLLDPARGTAHFDVPVSEAKSLHESLRRRLPGYLVPRLVREEAGQPYKTLL
jgi:EF-P beta-lysylation protein EpmB